jgi:DNA repair exonuclease SbcCD ATPase subunit
MHQSKTEDSMIFSLSPTLSHSTKLEFDLGSRPGHRVLPFSSVSRPEIGKIPLNHDSVQRREAPISEIEIPSDSEHTAIVEEQIQIQSDEELRKSLSSMIDAHAALTTEMGEVCQEKRDIKSELSTQVSCLKQQLKELEAKEAEKEKAFQCKIYYLQNAKEKAEKNTSILENTFVTSSEKAKELVSHLRSQTVEVKSLKRKVTQLAAEKKYELSQAEEMRKSLVAEIQGLSVQLQREQTRVVNEKLALEERLRVEYEKVTSSDKIKMHELANEIKEARSEVEHLKKEKVALTACLKSLEHKTKGKDHVVRFFVLSRLGQLVS